MATKLSSPGLLPGVPSPIPVTAPGPATWVGGSGLWPPGGSQPQQPGVVQQAQPAAAQANACWCFPVVDGGCKFMTMTPGQETIDKRRAMLAECGRNTSAAITPMGFVDALVDIGEDIWNGVAQVATILVEGTKFAIIAVVNGTKKFFEGVWDTVDAVMDGVAWVLNAAGAALGAAVGWLLDHLGFLFNWKAIKAKRNELRELIQSRVPAALRRLPDPAIACGHLADQLRALQDSATDALQRFRTAPQASMKFAEFPHAPLANLVSGSPGGPSIMPQATWLSTRPCRCSRCQSSRCQT